MRGEMTARRKRLEDLLDGQHLERIGWPTTRAIQTRSAVVITDVLEDPEFQLAGMARVAGFRSVLSVPMLRGGDPIGAVTVTREASGPFPDKLIGLLQTFADQAVIAIENVRLFKELEARNGGLQEVLVNTHTYILIGMVALGPGIFWLWYLYKRETLEAEPVRLIVKMFFFGVLAAVLAAFLEGIVRALASSHLSLAVLKFLSLVIAAPIIEETAKFLVVWLMIYKSVEFNKPLDGIMYAVAVALGFATIENLQYVLAGTGVHPHDVIDPKTGAGVQDPKTGVVLQTLHFHLPWLLILVRALLSVPGHALFSSMWGYTLGLAKFRPPESRRALITRGLLMAYVGHSLFNLMAYVEAQLLLIVLVILMWRTLHRHVIEDFAYSATQSAPRSTPKTGIGRHLKTGHRG
jgi:protease PrsW